MEKEKVSEADETYEENISEFEEREGEDEMEDPGFDEEEDADDDD